MTARIDLRRDLEAGGPELRIEVSRRGSTQVVALVGEARVWDERPLKAAVSKVLLAAPRDIVVDLSACTLLSSLGVARLIEMSQFARRTGGRVHLAAARPNVLEVIRTLRLEQLFPVHDTLEAALAATLRRASA